MNKKSVNHALILMSVDPHCLQSEIKTGGVMHWIGVSSAAALDLTVTGRRRTS